MRIVPPVVTSPSATAIGQAGRDAAPVGAATRVAPIGDPLRESLRRGTAPQFAAGHGGRTASLDLSPAGRLLQAALAGAPRAPAPGDSTDRPLVERVPPLPLALAAGLARAIATSGVFYESHLARWARGGLTLAALRQEPQAAWPNAGADIAAELGSAPALPAEETLPLLQRQLDALDARTLTWSGTAWPGQDVTVTIAEDAENRRPVDGGEVEQDATGVRWHTRVVLTLPVLGRVEATLGLDGDEIMLRVTTAEPAAAQRLGAVAPQLASALAARALVLAHFDVEAAHAG